jgi:hypothetical protein
MKRTALRTASCGSIVFAAVVLIGLSTTSVTRAQTPSDSCNVTTPTTPITTALLSSGLPCAATITAPFTLDNIQHGFDFYSWLTFVALNAPAGGGVIGSGKGPGGDAAPGWQSWKDIGSIMLPGGAKPTPWGTPPTIPKICQGLAPSGTEIVTMVGKTPNVLSATNQPFKTGPLIDQNGQYVRYDIIVNEPMFDYIVNNTLYSVAGQNAFTTPVDFPPGFVTQPPPTGAPPKPAPGAFGAIMIKVAWKPLGKNDNPAKFHTMAALVYQPAQVNPKIKETCHKAVLGLVGMHIGHKTKSDPQWVWSTFEQVNNVPTDADVTAGHLQARYNFFNPKCGKAACEINDTPPRPWDPNAVPFPKGYHSQITRVIPITDEVKAMNAAFQSLLKGKVWQNYELISTQWPTDATSTTDPTGKPAPIYLANTTAETYIQGTVPQSSSNCIACHNNATTTNGRFSDFTYILENAK